MRVYNTIYATTYSIYTNTSRYSLHKHLPIIHTIHTLHYTTIVYTICVDDATARECLPSKWKATAARVRHVYVWFMRVGGRWGESRAWHDRVQSRTFSVCVTDRLTGGPFVQGHAQARIDAYAYRNKHANGSRVPNLGAARSAGCPQLCVRKVSETNGKSRELSMIPAGFHRW